MEEDGGGVSMERIVADPAICGGKPAIRGTRLIVRNIPGMIAGGYSIERIVESYPELGREDVQAYGY